MSSDKTPITPAARKRVGLALLTVAGTVLLVAVIVVLVVWRGGATAPNASGATDRPQPSNSTGPIQLGPATPVPTDAAPADSRIPADCMSLYTTDWSASLEPLVLNPAWTTQAENGPWIATDSTLSSQLQAATVLTCNWASPVGGSGQGIITNVAAIAADNQEQLIASIGSLGFTCYDELEGLRCIWEKNDDGTALGESHFIRDGIWLATKWIEVSPDGYTHDMVNTIFGTA
jgi:hypothetical protein